VPEFARPEWLILLAALPVFVFLRLRAGLGEGRFKRVAGTVLRSAAFGALALALAGPLKGDYSARTDVMFALDYSHSIGRETADRALAFVNQAIETKDPKTRMGLVVFGADASVEVLLRREAEPAQGISAQVERGGTNIARALEVAMAAFPPGGHKRVVLLSDGRENLGRAAAAAAVARSLGVEVYAVPLGKEAVDNEIHIQGINAPHRVSTHEPFEVQVALHSQKAAQAHLEIMRNGGFLREAALELKPGVNLYTFIQQMPEAGLYEYEAVVNSLADGMQENNRYQAFVEVSGAPRVLHAVGESGWGRYVTEALRTQGLAVDEMPGSALPTTMHQLLDYELVILNNVSGFDLSMAKMELLERYVRDAGGGLIMLGGDKSYSAGGYYGTTIERLLPVDMDVKTKVDIPSLAVTVIIDKSGSMSVEAKGERKIEIAKSAAFSAVELLNPFDRVGVLAFDTKYEWSVPLMEAGDRARIAEKLGGMRAGGGTNLFTALQEGHRAMRGERAKVRHLIILSDGLTEEEEAFEALCRAIAADGITITTVAFGHDANVPLMQRIADWGKGRFYFTDDPLKIPRIFTTETIVVSRGLIVEEQVEPRLRYPGEMLEGFAPDAYPPLSGYILTFAKPSAQVLLSARRGDPLLVTWRYGLGKAAAFTSDMSARWGSRWVAWPEFGRLTGQMARWAMRRRGNERLVPSFTWSGNRGEVVVDVLDRDDRFINGLELEASLVDPERRTTRFSLGQISPGRYRGEFKVVRSGRYYLNLSGSVEGVRVGPRTFGLVVPYSPEYLDLGVDTALLAGVAKATGGKVLELSSASLAAAVASQPRRVALRWRLWRPLLLAALLLLVLEIAVRRLVLPEAWRARWRVLRDRRRETLEAEPEYEELEEAIVRARRQHLEALSLRTPYWPEDPASRARLYLATLKQRSR